MNITQIEVNNFKVFENFTFKPKMLNVITGRNNTGKTTLLEAISITFNHETVLSKYRNFPGYLIREQSIEGFIKLTFSDHEKKVLKIEKASSEDVDMKLVDIFDNTLTNYFKTFNKNKSATLSKKDIHELSRLFVYTIKTSTNVKQLRNILYNNSIKIMESNKKKFIYLSSVKIKQFEANSNEIMNEFQSLINGWLKTHKKLKNAEVIKINLAGLLIAILSDLMGNIVKLFKPLIYETITKETFIYLDDEILVNTLVVNPLMKLQ